MLIQFDRPANMCFSVDEIDDHLPSICFDTKVSLAQSFDELSYRGRIWIECKIFDSFIFNLKNRRDECIIHDISKFFFIKVLCNDEQWSFIWEVKSNNCFGSALNITYNSVVDDDIISSICDAFVKFPKWW